MSRGIFWGKKFLCREFYPFKAFSVWAKHVCKLAAKSSAVISKLRFSCPGKSFGVFFEKNLRQGFRERILPVKNNLLKKMVFRWFSLGFSSVWDLANVFRTLGHDLVVILATIFQKYCQKCNILVHRKILQKKNHLVMFVFLYIILSHWAKEIVILEKNFCWAVKTAFIVCSRKIWGKKLAKSTLLLIFLDFRQKFLRKWANKLLQYCQNCLFLDQMELSRAKQFFQKLQLSQHILALSKNFQTLIENLSVGLSIPQSRCLEESFEEKELFCEKFLLSSFSTFGP